MMLSESKLKKDEADRIAFINDQKTIMKMQLIAEWLQANPDVGTLTRDGAVVFYSYPAGGSYVEVEALS